MEVGVGPGGGRNDQSYLGKKTVSRVLWRKRGEVPSLLIKDTGSFLTLGAKQSFYIEPTRISSIPPLRGKGNRVLGKKRGGEQKKWEFSLPLHSNTLTKSEYPAHQKKP